MSMLERAARAACIAAGDVPISGTWDSVNDCKGPLVWEMFLPQARAVLMAVREPDRKLSFIGAEAADDGGRYEQPMPGQCADAFTAMIDAILNETPE